MQVAIVQKYNGHCSKNVSLSNCSSPVLEIYFKYIRPMVSKRLGNDQLFKEAQYEKQIQRKRLFSV